MPDVPTVGFAPSTLAAANILVAGKPVLGGEKVFKVSPYQIREVGRFVVTGSNAGTWTGDAVNTLGAAGEDIVAVILNPTGVISAAEIALTVTARDPADVTGPEYDSMSLVATIAAPAWSRVQANRFPIGWGTDCIQAAGKKAAVITGATVVCNADAAGAIIGIYAMPALNSYVEIPCAEDVSWDSQAPESIAIPCGMDGTAFTKPGRSGERSLKASTHLISGADGFSRYDGSTVTAQLQMLKEGSVETERYFFASWQVKATPNLPSGNSVATSSAEGKFTLCIAMFAP